MDILQVLQTSVKEYTSLVPRLGSTFLETTQRSFYLQWLPTAGSPTLDSILAIFLAFLILVFLFQSIAALSNKHNKARQTSLGATQALSVVFTPTSAAWPPAFISHFGSAKANERRLELSLSELFDHILQGRLEIRDYRDLPDLFRGLWAYGWCIKIRLDGRWYFKTAKWLAAQHVSSACGDLFRGRNGMLHSQITFIDLDFVPYSCLETELRRIHVPYEAGSFITVELSCLASDIAFMSTQFILCAIPLLPRAFGKRMKRKPRTSTLLLMRLGTIIALLSSLSYRIVCVDNVSSGQAAILQKLEMDLVDNKSKRVECIKDFGVAGWREERFMFAWEAALLTSGILIRWRIVMEKPQKLK